MANIWTRWRVCQVPAVGQESDVAVTPVEYKLANAFILCNVPLA